MYLFFRKYAKRFLMNRILVKYPYKTRQFLSLKYLIFLLICAIIKEVPRVSTFGLRRAKKMRKFFFMTPVIFAITLILLALGASGCDKQMGGTLVGAGLGGLAGSQIGSGSGKLAATGAGVLLGALLGGEAGRSLDRADHLYAERAAVESFESGRRAEWRSNRHRGYTTPQRSYHVDQYEQYEPHSGHSRQQCREYQTTVMVGGRERHAYGTACRQPDGSWKITNR